MTIFWKIALPKTLPEFFGALKVSVTLAFIGTNLMEIVEPHGRGLGALFDSGKISADYPLMFAVLIALAFLGIVLFYIVVWLEKILPVGPNVLRGDDVRRAAAPTPRPPSLSAVARVLSRR